MAPALTEPMSTADKLSNRTSTTTTSSSSSLPNTRSSKRLENASPILAREKRVRVSTPILVNRRTRSNSNRSAVAANTLEATNQEKPSSTTSPVASPSPQSSSLSLSPSPPSPSPQISTTTTSATKTPSPSPSPSKLQNKSQSHSPKAPPVLEKCLNNNEQMGLSNATSLIKVNTCSKNQNLQVVNCNNNDLDTHLDKSKDKDKDKEKEKKDTDKEEVEVKLDEEEEDDQQKVTSTEQLLADLTDEFGGALTAEICLRRQLADTKEADLKEAKDLILIKPGKGGAPEVNSTLMESPTTTQDSNENETETENVLDDDNSSKTAQNNENLVPINNSKQADSSLENQKDEDSFVTSNSLEGSQTQSENNEVKENIFIEPPPKLEVQNSLCNNKSMQNSDASSSESGISLSQLSDEKPIITSVQVLPRINTDSTMSASEIEDNIEERLMMLEGCISSSTTQGQSIQSSSPLPPNRTPLIQNVVQISSPQSQFPPCDSAQLQLHQPQQPHQHLHQPQLQPIQYNLSSNAGQFMGQQTSQLQLQQHHQQQPTSCNEFEDQDIEEVLKVLKGFDGSSTFDGDLNNLFNEVYTSLNCDDMTGGGVSNNAGVVGGGSGVGVGNLATSSHPQIQTNESHISSITEIKPSPLEMSHMEICKTQTDLANRVNNQLKRLRVVQARHMCRHISEEIAGLFEWSVRWSSKNSKGTTDHSSDGANGEDSSLPYKFILQPRPPGNTWQAEQKTLLPLKQINKFLKRLKTVASAQQENATIVANNAKQQTLTYSMVPPVKRSKKSTQPEFLSSNGTNASSSPSLSISSNSPVQHSSQIIKTEPLVPLFDEDVTEELYQVSGSLQCQLKQIKHAYDSDATETSSGAESADEAISYNNQSQQQKPISQRASYRYSRDRARIASRWSWLQSQSAHTEIKIRLLTDVSGEARKTKANSYLGITLDANPKSPDYKSLNGYKNDCQDSSMDYVNESEALPGCARTRINLTKQFRKRKLLQTGNLHLISKKAARPSTVKCKCQWPLSPCALCTGRSDPTAIRDPPDAMTRAERIALVDAGFHHVLSLEDEDVSTSLHFEAVAASTDWQNRVMRCQAKSIVKSVWKAEREAAAASVSARRHNGEPKRRYVRRKEKISGERRTSDGVPLGCALNSPKAVTTDQTSVNDEGFGETGKPEGNGTGLLSSTSCTTTPLVANSIAKQKKIQNHHYQDYIMNSNNSINNTSLSNQQQQNINKLNKLNKQRIRSTSSTFLNATTITHANNQHNNINHNITQNFTNNYSSSSTLLNSHSGYNHFNGSNGDVSDAWDRSRTSSPTHSHHKNERLYDRKSRSSYDIDNIIIPYSVAATTKVEILPYKEIPIPRWRVIEDESNEGGNIGSDTCNEKEIEDASVNGDNSEISDAPKEVVISHTEETNLMTKVSSFTSSPTKSYRNNVNKVALQKSEKFCNAKSIEEKAELSHKSQKSLSEDESINDKESVDSDFKEPLSKKAKMDNSPNVCEKGDVKSPLIKVDGKDEEETDTSSETSFDETEAAERHNFVKPEDIKKTTRSSARLQLKTSNENKGKDKDRDLLPPPPPKISHSQDATPANLSSNSNSNEGEEFELEDISDEAIMLRHERAHAEEKKKFQALLKLPWSSRSRANRRMDSRTESSGANTPDPASPAPRTPSIGGGDNESIPSPLAPSTPLTPLDSISEAKEALPISSKECPLNSASISNTIQKRYERRRTTSAKKDTHDLANHIEVPPYEPLIFPLSDELYNYMLSQMPEDYRDIVSSTNDYLFQEPSESEGFPKTNCDAHIPLTSLRSSCSSVKHKNSIGGIQPRNSSSLERNHIRSESTSSSKIHDEDHDLYNDGVLEDDDIDHATSDSSGDEDFYPKHHLAPPKNDAEDLTRLESSPARKDSDRSSDSEPFQDDDPNDPEWKGEKRERIEKSRRRFH